MLEHRKILTAMCGYIIGIIMGLYCKISIVPFYLILYLLTIFYQSKQEKNQYNIYEEKQLKPKNSKTNLKLISPKRYFRYIKIIFTKKVIKVIVVFSIISNSIVLFQNNRYQNLYKNLEGKDINIRGTIVEICDSKCKVKVKNGEYKNTYLLVYLKSNQNTKLEYGDKIKLQGEYVIPQEQTNYKGFSYKNYLKTLKIYGIVKAKEVTVESKNNVNSILKLSNQINLKIQQRIEESNFAKEEKALIKAIMIGNKEELESDSIENFSKANISHILAISGMHIFYIILISNFIFNKLIGKHYSKIITVIVIVIYMFITNFSTSVVRAGISGILLLLSHFFFRKNDTFQSLAISLFIILIENPYSINSISLQLSFAGTIGIIVFQPTIKRILTSYLERKEKRAIRKNKKITKKIIILIKTKLIQILIDSYILTISATIMVMQVVLVNFNKINISSLIISTMASFIIGPIVILGIIFIITKIKFPLEIFIKILIYLSKSGSKLPFNQIYFITPDISQIIIYYILIFSFNLLIKIYIEKKPSSFQKRIKNLVSFVKYKINLNKKKIISIILIICLIFFVLSIIPKNLKIYFVDVGQRRLYINCNTTK